MKSVANVTSSSFLLCLFFFALPLMHACKLDEVMFVSDIHAIFRSSGRVVFATADSLNGQYSRLKGTFQFSRWGRALLFALACCLTIAMSACGADVSVPLGGGGLLVSPGTINFGNVPVGHEVDGSVSITNSNSSSIVVSQVNVSGQRFSLLSNSSAPISIPAGGTYNLKIGFKPASTVVYSGQITLMDTSAKMIAQVPMQGAGAISGRSAVDGERDESELWQFSGEHGDNSVVDADVNGDVASDG
jgi:hypothetical protein